MQGLRAVQGMAPNSSTLFHFHHFSVLVPSLGLGEASLIYRAELSMPGTYHNLNLTQYFKYWR